MSDPRQFERNPNLPRNIQSDNRSSLGDTSVWIAIIAAILVVFGAVTYYGGSSTEPTTSGQSTRTPVPATPPATTTPATPPAMPAPVPQP